MVTQPPRRRLGGSALGAHAEKRQGISGSKLFLAVEVWDSEKSYVRATEDPVGLVEPLNWEWHPVATGITCRIFGQLENNGGGTSFFDRGGSFVGHEASEHLQGPSLDLKTLQRVWANDEV